MRFCRFKRISRSSIRRERYMIRNAWIRSSRWSLVGAAERSLVRGGLVSMSTRSVSQHRFPTHLSQYVRIGRTASSDSNAGRPRRPRRGREAAFTNYPKNS